MANQQQQLFHQQSNSKSIQTLFQSTTTLDHQSKPNKSIPLIYKNTTTILQITHLQSYNLNNVCQQSVLKMLLNMKSILLLLFKNKQLQIIVSFILKGQFICPIIMKLTSQVSLLIPRILFRHSLITKINTFKNSISKLINNSLTEMAPVHSSSPNNKKQFIMAIDTI